MHKDIAVGVGEGIVGRGQRQIAEEDGVHEGLVGIDRKSLGLVYRTGFRALPQRVPGICE